MKNITILMIGVCLFLSSCANLFSPPYDSRLEGTWEGSISKETIISNTDILGNENTTKTIEFTREKYTFYNGNEVKKERSWSKETTSNGALTSANSSNGTSTYEWKDFIKSHTIDYTNSEPDKININGFELIKQ